MPFRVRAALLLLLAASCAHAEERELHRWCLQRRDGTLRQDIAREVIRRVNRVLYNASPGTQLLREDEDVRITVDVRPGPHALRERSLVEVIVGPVVERDSLEDMLGPDLYDDLVKRDYYWIEEPLPSSASVPLAGGDATISEILEAKTLKDVYWWSPSDYSLSLYYGFARVSDRAGLFVEFGQDELNYPLWSAGTFRAGVTHEFVKLWITSPLLGPNTVNFFTRRLIDGGVGAGGAFDVGSAGGMFGFAEMTAPSSGITILDTANIHYVNMELQAYYIMSVPLPGPLPGLARLKFGGGLHEVVEARADIARDKIVKLDRGKYRGGPLVRAEFATTAVTGTLPEFEASLQYYNGGYMITAAYNVTSWLGIEAKAAGFFTPDPWEQRFMWGVSPRIRI